MSDDYYDAVYEVWQRGGNPDEVNPDEIDYYRSRGFDVEQSCEMEVERVLGRRVWSGEYEGDEES